MKIGIITQPLHSNYGGLLQNYALQQVLKRFGHEVVTLDQSHLLSSQWRIYVACIKTFLLRLIHKGNNRLYFWESKRLYKNTQYFINKYINHSKKLNRLDEFQTYVRKSKIEAFVVGSDQVWRPIYNHNILRSFLDFTNGLDVKRISYAASFGVDYWEFNTEQTEQCKRLIKRFDAVSVREDSGVDLCRMYLSCDALHVLDPTMLLNKEDYINLVEKEGEFLSKGNLFAYILDDSAEKNKIIQDVASALSLTPFSSMPLNKVVNKESIKNLNSCVFPPVTRWLRSFMDAKFVICDSFHGAVFSIIFNTPFLVIGNKERGMSRFNSLLKMFELENRILNLDSLDLSIINTPINWKKVNTKRESLKSKSLEFILDSLK